MQMRRFIVGAVVLGIGLSVPAATAFAGSSPKATGSVGSPGGSAQANGPVPFTVVFTAQGSGTGVKGNFTFTRADGQSFSVANVTCLSIVGNKAGMSGIITSSSGSNVPAVGQIGYIAVSDNGQGSNSTGPDMVQVDAGSQYSNCNPTLDDRSLPYTVTSGTVQITPGS